VGQTTATGLVLVTYPDGKMIIKFLQFNLYLNPWQCTNDKETCLFVYVNNIVNEVKIHNFMLIGHLAQLPASKVQLKTSEGSDYQRQQ
jgi:hypothetical protein